MNSFYSLVISIGLFSILILTTIANNQNTGKFQKIIITPYDKTIITNYSYHVKPMNRYTTLIGGYAFPYIASSLLKIHAKVYKKLNVVYKPFLVDVNENMCDALSKNSAAAPYTRIVLQMVKRYTNLNHPCPYVGWFTLTNATLDLSQLRLVVPSGDYRLDFVVALNNSPIKTFKALVFVEIGEK